MNKTEEEEIFIRPFFGACYWTSTIFTPFDK
jgi:hypothetical protein